MGAVIRVVIIAGTRLYREGLAQLLTREPLLTVVATQPNGQQALSELTKTAPDVVLLDMATDESHATARELRLAAPSVRVVAIGIADSDAEVVACAELGVAGYVTRDGSLEELVATMHSAAKGELICTPRTAGTLIRRLATLAAQHDSQSRNARLTRRELEIAELLFDSLSNKEIAVRLRIEVATVKNHVHNLMEKLHIHRRAETGTALGHHASSGRAARIPVGPLPGFRD